MPLSYILFEDLFHLALDIVFFWINCLMLMYVIRTKQRQHIRWLAPSLAACFFALFYRLVVVGHRFLGTVWTPQHYMVVDSLLDLESVLNLVSTVLLWKVLKSAGFRLPAAAYSVPETPTSGAWPPAPRS